MTDTTQDHAAALAAEEAAKAAAKAARDAGLPDDLTDEDMADVLTEEELALLQPEPEQALPAAEEPPAQEVAPETPPAAPEDALSAWDAPDPVMPTRPEVPADAEAKIAELDGALDGLIAKFEEGELTQEEFRRQQRDLIAQQSAAQVALERARAEEEQAASAAQAYIESWGKKLDAYRAQHGYLWDQAHLGRWDAHLRGVNSNPAYAAMPMADRIQLAHRLYAAEYEVATKQALPSQPGLAKPGKAAATVDVPKPPTDKRPDPVQTLANFPAAASIAVDDGKFAAIDRIMPADPLRAEALLASLSDAEMAAYLT